MVYKGCRYSVEKDGQKPAWRWTVFLDAHLIASGLALTRGDAISIAESEIDRAEQAGELI
jgi:hypothetical protein